MFNVTEAGVAAVARLCWTIVGRQRSRCMRLQCWELQQSGAQRQRFVATEVAATKVGTDWCWPCSVVRSLF